MDIVKEFVDEAKKTFLTIGLPLIVGAGIVAVARKFLKK